MNFDVDLMIIAAPQPMAKAASRALNGNYQFD